MLGECTESLAVVGRDEGHLKEKLKWRSVGWGWEGYGDSKV